jgi:hypothetical protein
MRFEVDVRLADQIYSYVIAFELPAGFRELRVAEEKLVVGGTPVFSRMLAQVRIPKTGPDAEARFPIDWHLVALPIVQGRSPNDPLVVFKQWLARMLILRPMPALITGDSSEETLQPNREVTDFGAWFAGLLGYAPAAYAKVDQYLKAVMPDFKDIKNPLTGMDSRSLVLQFATEGHPPCKSRSAIFRMARSASRFARWSSRRMKPMDGFFVSGMSLTTIWRFPRWHIS